MNGIQDLVSNAFHRHAQTSKSSDNLTVLDICFHDIPRLLEALIDKIPSMTLSVHPILGSHCLEKPAHDA